jgi:hypothetical protein
MNAGINGAEQEFFPSECKFEPRGSNFSGTTISVSEPPNQTPLKSSEMVILNPSASVSNMGMLGQTFAFSHSEIFPRSMPN